MSRRGLPLVPTLMTLLALPLLLGLGFWQLQRADWKAGVLASLSSNAGKPPVAMTARDDPEAFQFRRIWLDLACEPSPPTVKAGRNAAGETGFSFLLSCASVEGASPSLGRFLLDIGWGRRPDGWKAAMAGLPPPGTMHRVEAVLVRRDGAPRWLLVATDAPPPLVPSAPPSIETIPNNHRSYAVQWFSFAAILAAVYAAFVARWRRGR